MLSISDLQSISEAALRVDKNPVGLAGRLIGLSADEQRAGVPGYACVGLGIGVGLIGGILLAKTDIFRRFFGD